MDIEKLENLGDLKDKDLITQEEFDLQKKEILKINEKLKGKQGLINNNEAKTLNKSFLDKKKVLYCYFIVFAYFFVLNSICPISLEAFIMYLKNSSNISLFYLILINIGINFGTSILMSLFIFLLLTSFPIIALSKLLFKQKNRFF